MGRYIGTTDEPLCSQGRKELQKLWGIDGQASKDAGQLSAPNIQAVYVSPMKRTVETAEILFPNQRLHVIDELSECDFGEFENKNYKELADNLRYQQWIDSNGTLPFPGGESREAFRQRSVRGMEKAVNHCMGNGITRAALVVHGGTIMNVLEAFGNPYKPFYEWHVKNGGGYVVTLDEKAWRRGVRTLQVVRALQP